MPPLWPPVLHAALDGTPFVGIPNLLCWAPAVKNNTFIWCFLMLLAIKYVSFILHSRRWSGSQTLLCGDEGVPRPSVLHIFCLLENLAQVEGHRDLSLLLGRFFIVSQKCKLQSAAGPWGAAVSTQVRVPQPRHRGPGDSSASEGTVVPEPARSVRPGACTRGPAAGSGAGGGGFSQSTGSSHLCRQPLPFLPRIWSRGAPQRHGAQL